jgi:Carboxypeptidase regulatory-like domain
MRSYVLPLVLLVVAALGLWWFVGRGTSSARPPLAAPEAEGRVAPGDANSLEAGDVERREANSLPTAPSETTLAPKDKKHPSATVRARFVDGASAPIENVVLDNPGGRDGELGHSDASGTLEASVKVWTVEGDRLRLEARHPEFVARQFERVVRAGEVLDLGDVVLERGGVVSGRVADTSGRPVAKARIRLAPATSRSGAEQLGERPHDVTNSGESDEQGRFRLAGVPPGDTRAWASREQPPWSSTEPFAVRAGEETRDIELVLADAGPDVPHSMRFLVRTPEGAAAPGAWISYRARDAGGLLCGSMNANAEGIAELGADQLQSLVGGKIDVDAVDPKGRWGAAALVELVIAFGDYELRLSPATSHEVVVQAADGTRLTGFTWRLLDRVRYTRPDWTRTRTEPVRGLHSLDYFSGSVLTGHGEDLPRDRPPRAPQTLTVASGELPFVLQVEAPGFERAEAGPFAVASVPAVITITLEPLPEIRGTVVHAQQPVAGATVCLVRATASIVNGFPSRVAPQPEARTQSDAAGRFALPLREPGSYFVQAQSLELGIGEFGPAVFALEGARPDLLLEIADPGRIEGRLLLPEDAAGEDWIVGAARGDGKAYSCRATHAGEFRFEKLAPGRWLLRRLEREIAGGELRFSAGPEPAPLEGPWPYEVRPGETTRVEIDLRQQAELVGKLGIPGWETQSWTASLDPEGKTFGRGSREIDVVDGSEFHLVARPPGSYRLVLSAKRKDGKGWRSELESLTLAAGTQAWSASTSVGPVVLVNRRETENDFELVSEPGPGRTSKVNVTVAPHSEVEVGGVFAGNTRVTRYAEMQPSDEGSIVVQPGATLRFDRP